MLTRPGLSKSRWYLLCVSLTNLCFFEKWDSLLGILDGGKGLYHQPRTIAWYFVGLILHILVASILLYAVARWVTRYERWRRTFFLIFVAAFAYPLVQIREVAANRYGWVLLSARYWSPYLSHYVFVLLVLVLALAMFVWWLHRYRSFERATIALYTILSPLGLFTVAHGISILGPNLNNFLPKTPIAQIDTDSPRRLLWMVFDEFDYYDAFEAPGRPTMPEFSAFMKESFSFRHAFSPSNRTSVVLPSYVVGRHVKSSATINADTLLLELDNGEALSWKEMPNVFRTARKEGIGSALIGFYHPYCRVLGRDLDACQASTGLGSIFSKRIFDNLIAPLVPYRGGNAFAVAEDGTPWHLHTLRTIRGWLDDKKLGLIFAHWNIPHSPWICHGCEPFSSHLSLDGYRGNLAVADEMFGEVRKHMVAQGIWDSTAIIVTSDHGWRGDNSRSNEAKQHVPLIIKWPGQKTGKEWTGRFNTLAATTMAEAFLQGKLETVESAERWLNDHPMTPTIEGMHSTVLR